ncbi:hypothetical protein DXG01_013897, partial [Tephrocybe rancida]
SSLASTIGDMLSEWDSLSSWTAEHGSTFTFHDPSDVDAYTREFTAHAAHILHQHPGLELPDHLGLWFYQGIPTKYRSLNRACLLRLLLSHVEDVPFPTTREIVKILKDEISYDLEHPDAEYPLAPIHPKIIELIDSYHYRYVPDTRLLARLYPTPSSASTPTTNSRPQEPLALSPPSIISDADFQESFSLDYATQPLLNTSKVEYKPVKSYDVKREAPCAKQLSFVISEPLTSVNSMHQPMHINSHAPFDHAVPTAIRISTISTIEPANAVLTPTAIIDD